MVSVGQSQQVTVTEASSLDDQRQSLQRQKESVARQLANVLPVTRSKSVTQGHATRSIVFTSTTPQESPLWAPQVSGSESFSPIASFAPVEMPAMPWVEFPPVAFPCPALQTSQVESMIRSAAHREDLSPDLLRSVMKRESSFHPCAVSNKGALGLMQLMPATAEQFGVDDPFNPQQNIRGGAAFLKQLLNRFGGDVRLALSAYNAGPERVIATGGVPDLAETQDYVEAITSDLGLPPVPQTETTPQRKKMDSTPIKNVLSQPDLRHLRLPSPTLAAGSEEKPPSALLP